MTSSLTLYMFSVAFRHPIVRLWSSESLSSVQVDQLKQNLKFTALASKATGKMEKFCQRRCISPIFRSDLWLCLISATSPGVINWVSTFSSGCMSWREDSPTVHPTVIAVKEGAIRLASQPTIQRKEPSRLTISSSCWKNWLERSFAIKKSSYVYACLFSFP